ncbi:MAG: hypothetical protein V1872_12965 [bacterium]
MTREEMREELNIELGLMEGTVKELKALNNELSQCNPTIREKTAAAAFLAQFYNGVENILKRIVRFYEVSLPKGDTWHIDLFQLFCEPSTHPLPVLFNEEMTNLLAPYRKFRHVVYHGYGFQLEWERMKPGIEKIEEVFFKFKGIVSSYLKSLDPQ